MPGRPAIEQFYAGWFGFPHCVFNVKPNRFVKQFLNFVERRSLNCNIEINTNGFPFMVIPMRKT